jgi:hypothetical protein
MNVGVWSRNSTFSPRIFASVNYITSACARGMFADPYRNEPFRESNERTCQPPNTSTAGKSSSIDNTAVQLSGFCLDMTVLQIEYHTLLTFYLRLSSTSHVRGSHPRGSHPRGNFWNCPPGSGRGESRNAGSFPMSLATTYDDTQSHLPIYGSRMLRDLAYVPAKLNRVCIIKVCFHKVCFSSRSHQGVICFVSTQALRRYSR